MDKGTLVNTTQQHLHREVQGYNDPFWWAPPVRRATMPQTNRSTLLQDVCNTEQGAWLSLYTLNPGYQPPP